MKKLALFLSLVLTSSCDQNTVPSQQQLVKDHEVQTPTASPTASTFPELTDEESQSLEEKLPTKVRQVLTDAKELELFDVGVRCAKLSPETLAPVEPNKFAGCRYKKKIVISDARRKQQLLDVLFYGTSTSDRGMACFDPQFGVRAMNKGERVELIICFKCENFRGVSTAGEVGGGISTAPKEMFEQIFAN